MRIFGLLPRGLRKIFAEASHHACILPLHAPCANSCEDMEKEGGVSVRRGGNNINHVENVENVEGVSRPSRLSRMSRLRALLS